jgi:hypothetical protein
MDEVFAPKLGPSLRAALERCVDEGWNTIVLATKSHEAALFRAAVDLGFASVSTSTFDANNQWERFTVTPFLHAYVGAFRKVFFDYPPLVCPCASCERGGSRGSTEHDMMRGRIIGTLVFPLGGSIATCDLCGSAQTRIARPTGSSYPREGSKP